MHTKRKIYIEPYFGDEFNQFISTAVVADLARKHFGEEVELYTYSLENFVGLYNAYDKILTVKDQRQIRNMFQVLGEADQSTGEMLKERILKDSEIKLALNKYLEDNDIEKDIIKIGDFFPHGHPYDYNYKNLSRNMQENSFTPFLTTHGYYEKYKSDKPVITINGRWYQGERKRQQWNNNRFEFLIAVALSEGFTIYNVTDLKPNLPIQHPEYIELDNNKLSYLEKIAIFQNSNAVISVGNSGGITTHICNIANFYCYGVTDSMDNRWVDNVRYDHNGKSIAESRREMWPELETTIYHHPKYFNEHTLIKTTMDEIKKLFKPEIIKFFDESKIVYL